MPAPALTMPKALKPLLIAPPTFKVPAVTVIVESAPKVTAPLPVVMLLVPVKVKEPFQLCARFAPSVKLAPEVLSMVPPLRVRVPLPRALAWPMFKVPAVRVTPPSKVLLPFSVSAPAPSLVRLKVAVPSPMTPPIVRVLPTVAVTLSPRVMAPVPRFSVFEPVKMKLPFQFWTLLPARAMAPAPVSMMVSAPMLNVPVPRALSLPMTKLPATRLIPPAPVLLPLSVREPAPVLLIR